MRFDLKQRALSQKTIIFFKARQLCFAHPPTGSRRSVWVWLSFSGRWEEDQSHKWMLAGDPTAFHPGGATLVDPPGAPLDPLSPGSSGGTRDGPSPPGGADGAPGPPGQVGFRLPVGAALPSPQGVPALSTHTHCLAQRAPPAPCWALGSIILRASWF